MGRIFERVSPASQAQSRKARIVASNSKNVLSFSCARTTKAFRAARQLSRMFVPHNRRLQHRKQKNAAVNLKAALSRTGIGQTTAGAGGSRPLSWQG